MAVTLGQIKAMIMRRWPSLTLIGVTGARWSATFTDESDAWGILQAITNNQVEWALSHNCDQPCTLRVCATGGRVTWVVDWADLDTMIRSLA